MLRWLVAVVLVAGCAGTSSTSPAPRSTEPARVELVASVEVVDCGNDEGRRSEGTATNESDVTADVFMKILYRRDGAIVGDRAAMVLGLRPGASGAWDVGWPRAEFDECSVSVSSVQRTD